MDKIIKHIFISLIISMIAYAYYVSIGGFVLRLLSLLGIIVFYVLILRFILLNFKKRIKIYSYVNLSVKIFGLITFIILLFSIELNQKDLISLFFNPIAFSAYFLGIVILLINNKSTEFLLKTAFQFNRFLPLVTIIDIVFFNSPILLISGYSILIFEYVFCTKKKRKLFLLISLISTIFLLLIFDYRSGVLLITAFLVSLFLVNYLTLIRLKSIRYILLVGVLSIFTYAFLNFTVLYTSLTNSLNLSAVNTIDTRSFLFLEFFNDFHTSDYFMGKGYLGTYYSPYFKTLEAENGDYFNRFSIEIGILQFLLKGGLALLLSFLTIALLAVYKGFLKSKPNSVRFKLAIWLLIEIGLMTIENSPTFSLHFLVIWIIIGILFLKKKRQTNIRMIKPTF